MEAVGSEQPAAPAVPSTAAADAAAHNATAPPAAPAEPAPRSREEEQAAAFATLLGVPMPDAAARYQALLQPSPAPAAGGDQHQQQQQAVVRVEYSCVDVSDRYLVCGSNTGVVDVYAHDGRAGGCRLLKALVPPQRSRHTNVKLTCVKLGPRDRMLAVGNILGAVNVIMLELDFAGGANNKAQRMVHSHAHHEEAVRCLVWDEGATRLYSGCDGGVIVETRLLLPADASKPPPDAVAGSLGAGVGSALSLLGSAPLGLGLGSTLASLFQGCSSAVWQREESEIIQLSFHSLAGENRLPPGMQRPGDPPADALLLATHARRCNVHLLNRSHPKSLLYSIQVEGGGSSSSGRTIHGAAVVLGTHPNHHHHHHQQQQQQQQVDFLHLYISRPHGKFWLLDLGAPNQPVKTLTPTLLPHVEAGPPPSLGGRLFLLPPLRREGDGRSRRWMLSWTPLGALYVLAMEGGGDDVDEREEQEREDDGSRAVCLWSRGLHSLALLAGDVGPPAARLVLLHDPDKAIGMLELGPLSGDTYGPAVERGVTALQRAWREKRAAALHGELQGLLDAIRGTGQRSREQYRQAMRAAQRGGHTATVLQAPVEEEEEEEEEEEDPAMAVMLAEVDAACARARAFVASVAPALPPPGAGPDFVAAAPGGDGGGGGEGEMDGAAGALVDMVEALLAESRRLVGGGGGREWEPATATAAADAGGAGKSGAVPAAGEEQEDEEQGRQSQSDVKRQRGPVLYRGLARRHGGPAVHGHKEKRRAPLATTTSAPATVMTVAPTTTDVAPLPTNDGGVRSAMSALAQLQYDVTLVASSGLGLDLAFVGTSVVVRGLAFLPDGRPSPAQLCGRIRPGDVLLAVNDVALEPLGLKDKLGVLLALGGQRDAEISLRFMAKEASALGRALLPASGPAAYHAGSGQEEEEGIAAEGSNPFLPPLSQSPIAPSSSFLSLDEEKEVEEEENEDDSGGETGAVLGLTEPQRRAMQEKMVELGLLKPSNVSSSSISSSASMVQQLLSTIVGGGRIMPRFQRGPSAPEGSASGSKGKRRWGEAGGLGDGVGLGLAQPPEAMERELHGIARDVRILWAAQQRAAGRSSQFCGGGTEAVSPSLLAEEGREMEEEEGTRLRRLAAAWVGGQRQGARGKGAKGRKGRKQQSQQQQQRDIAQEYLGLLYFKNLLKRSLVAAEATQPTTIGAPAGAKEAAGVGAPVIRRRQYSREWAQEEEDGGTSDEEREEVEEGGSTTLVPVSSQMARAAPLQVYLEAVPLSDVLAELGGGKEEEQEEEGEAREEEGEEEDGGGKRRVGWMGPVVEEEDAQDLERALQVLSRALEATLETTLQEPEDGGGGGGRPWPPIQATHVTGMAVAVQQAHAILGSSEVLLQEWLRCFDPLPPERRGVLQESSSAFLGAHLINMDREDANAIAQHHRLTCQLVTLFFHMHTVWALLEKPPASASVSESGESPSSAAAAATAGAEEVQLRIVWGRRPLNSGERVGGEEEEDGEDGCLDPATGIQRPPRGRGEGRPSQWAEGEAMAFLEEYGAYVVLDGVAQACMARGFARTLRWVAQELAPAEGRFRAAEAALGEALEALAVDFSEEAAAALVRRVAGQGAEGEGEGKEGPDDGLFGRTVDAVSGDDDDGFTRGTEDAALCLAFRLLQRAVALPAAAAPAAISVARRLCAALFPHLRPWAVRDLLAASGQAEEHHDALLAAVDAAWAKALAAAMKKGGAAAAKSRARAALLPLPAAFLPSLGLREGAPRFVLDAEEEGEGGGGVPVPVLQRALQRRIAHLRRGIAAADVLTAAHSHVWEQAALVEAGVGGIDGCGRGGSSLPRRPQVLPPLLQSVAMLEATADAGQEVAWGEEEEVEAEKLVRGKEAVGDPVEGPGGLGVPLGGMRLWEEGLRCEACFLPCYDHSGVSSSGGGSGGNTAVGQMRDVTAADSSALVLFACQHAFHARCLPERACTLCLRENFAPF